ncbi:MAG TPA: DUF5132 domain-containing protein [Bacillota bacterium]|nr:DUF5132 domain-containing protein [Bacillota bacterium]
MFQRQIEKVIVGAAFTAAASVLLPILKETLPPTIRAGREGLNSLVHRGKDSLMYIREEIEDIVAEAQFERMKKQMDREIGFNAE